MKNLLKKIAIATLMSGAIAVSNPAYSQISETQKQETTKEQKLLPDLNFYFETGDYKKYSDTPEFKKNIQAWLCDCPKEDGKGYIFFRYGDTDDDGFYDYVNIFNYYDKLIKSEEKFSFDFDTKKIDYALEIYENCHGTNCDRIIRKDYNEINQEEAKSLGEGFYERIKEFTETQKEFSRFNSDPLENLVRKEAYHALGINAYGNLVGNSRIPIEKLLSEEEIKKVENYHIEKPERDRIKKEQEEKVKAEQEKREKIRIEKEEAKKPKVRLKIGGGIAINSREGHTGFFLGITPQLSNKKGKGFAIGLDMFVMNSETNFEDSYRTEDEERLEWLPAQYTYKYLISKTLYENQVFIKNFHRLGFKIGYVSPVLGIFANVGFLGRKTLITTTAEIEEYTEIYGTKQGQSSFKTEITNFERKNYFGSRYAGLGIEIFPYFKKEGSEKNISFSIDGLFTKGGYIHSPNSYKGLAYSPGQVIIKAGLKYTFGK